MDKFRQPDAFLFSRRPAPSAPGGGETYSHRLPGQGPIETVIQPVVVKGGELLEKIVHPQFKTTENLNRISPTSKWFSPTLSSRQTVSFEILSFTVPPGQQLWMTDYEFRVFRQSGIDPDDVVPAEEGRFSNQMGFDVLFSGKRLSVLKYGLQAVQAPTVPTAYNPAPNQRAIPDQFTRAAAQGFAASSGVAQSLLPVWSKVQGSRNMPFTLIADERSVVQLQCVIFSRIPAPIAFVEGRLAGYQVDKTLAKSLIEEVRAQ